jgi:hypothetical protein
MKFTSIVFAALVAATQFSSTFAGTKDSIAVADTNTTAYETSVTIDVSLTDSVADDTNAIDLSIAAAFAAPDYEIITYRITVDDAATDGTVSTKPGTLGDGSTFAGKPEQIYYTPKDGFTGEDTFDYTFMVMTKLNGNYGLAGKSNSVTVKVTVGAKPPAVIKQTFEIPGLVSSGDAVKYTHEGLSNIVAVTPGTPDTDSFNAILKPVFGGSADFAANNSTEVVQQNFSDIFLNFYNFFRGGN